MKKRLCKSSRDKFIFGTAGGIAEYFDIDSVFVRVLFVLLTLFHGSGILIYIICSIVMPKDWKYLNVNQPDEKAEQEIKPQSKNKEKVIGIILIVLGAIFFLDNFVQSFDFDDYFPIVLICLGAWLLSIAFRKENAVQ